ncbi:MAG: glycosyltransferase family 4 protein [Phycisphaerales bacterium]|nr:glycosyltransferase family 4 protein [Phycisphaerales bacterium]
MKVVICWLDVSGYTAACWKALAGRPGIDLFVLTRDLAAAMRSGANHTGFDSRALIAGLPHRLLTDAEFADAAVIEKEVLAQRPDAVVIPGWATPQYNRLASLPGLEAATFIMGMDTAWTGSTRQLAGRWLKLRFFRSIDAAVVAGERAYRLARWLGFRDSQLERGVYGLDYAGLAPALTRRLTLPAWPRRFLFVGRYVPDKGLDILLDAYGRYRSRTTDPWTLTCCGRGPDAALLKHQPGVTDRGFVQPGDLPGLFADHGCFILPSRYEPWGVVLAEAAAAGLPLIATDACGASIDVLHNYHNGLVLPTPDAAALAAAMTWVHENTSRLPDFGRRGQALASAYSAAAWAERWHALLLRLDGQ